MRRICLIGAGGIARVHAELVGRIPKVSGVAIDDPACVREATVATGR